MLVGTVLLRLTFTGTYRRYVQERMGPWLVVAGVAVIVLGAATLVRAYRAGSAAGAADAHGHDHDDDHDHQHGERIGWLLLAPIAALLLVAPPALGSYGVDRSAGVDVRAGAPDFEALAAGEDPVPMTLLEFSQRAADHDGASFGGVAVQLTGFVAGGDGFRLARYQIACCAADAAPVVVRVVGTNGDPPARDQWVTVTGTFRPGGTDVPELEATSVVEIPEPTDPYE
jgi:uncharacterized repeat protein (TIGR03943 family)